MSTAMLFPLLLKGASRPRGEGSVEVDGEVGRTRLHVRHRRRPLPARPGAAVLPEAHRSLVPLPALAHRGHFELQGVDRGVVQAQAQAPGPVLAPQVGDQRLELDEQVPSELGTGARVVRGGAQ